MSIAKKLAQGLLVALFAANAVPSAAQSQGPAQSGPQDQQQTQPQRPQFVTEFDHRIVTYLLDDVRASWQAEPSNDGHTVYRASAEGAINFTLSPRACSPEGECSSLLMLAVFTGVNAPSMAQLDTFLNRLNDTSPSIKAFRNEQGVVVLQAYANAAGGITYRNAQAQLLVFGQDIVTVSQALAQFEQGR